MISAFKMTKQEFINKAKEKHGNKYDYSFLPDNIINSLQKVKILCKFHNKILLQTVWNHLSGKGCLRCRSRKWNKNNFIKKCSKIHNNKYDYSKVSFFSVNDKINIICPIHGNFLQRASNHLRGAICPICSHKKIGTLLKSTQKEFINKAKEKHGNKYNYKLVIYKGSRQKVKIICLKHGIFEQSPNTHLNCNGCKKCGIEKATHDRTSTTSDFIVKANKKHKNKYDYSLVDYKINSSKVKILCPIHGIFEQTPSVHLYGYGCPRCSGKKQTREDIINKFEKIYGKDKYNYSLFIEYKNVDQKIKIKCLKCSKIFEKIIYKHINGSGCSCYSRVFKGEKAIEDWLIKNNIEYKHEYSFSDCLGKKNHPFRFDFYLPKLNKVIEYDGAGHFRDLIFGSHKVSNKEINKNDKIKSSYCLSHNIPLIRIPYWEFKNIENILNERILYEHSTRNVAVC
jgi:hypothetical protein